QIAGLAPDRQLAAEHLADAHGQRAADAADFQGVGQTGVDVIVAGDRMHLGLAAQAAEGTGEDEPVMILVKGAATQFINAVRRLAEPFAGEQGVPVQGCSSPFDGSIRATLGALTGWPVSTLFRIAGRRGRLASSFAAAPASLVQGRGSGGSVGRSVVVCVVVGGRSSSWLLRQADTSG